MKLRTIARQGKEGIKNLGRNGWMTFASISAVVVTLFIVGVFLVILLNLNAIGSQIEDDVEINVHIDPSASKTEEKQLELKLKGIPQVESVIYLTKEEGLEKLIDRLGDDGNVFASLKEDNPLPNTFIVKTTNPKDTIAVAEKIETFESVYNVEYGKLTVQNLFKVMNISRIVGLALIIGLLITAMFLIANTIKLTIFSRRKEIEIMKLVGATNAFIRWPFFFEGMLIGLLGSILPIAAVIIGYRILYEAFYANFMTALLVKLLPTYPFVYQVSGLLLLIGTFIGVWGSLFSIRKFLKV